MSETYVTIQGDMWDGIAYKLYGTEAAMNLLLRANPSYADMVIFPSGITLRLPAYTAPRASRLPPWRT